MSEWLDLLCLAPKGRVRASEWNYKEYNFFFIRMTFLRNRSIEKTEWTYPKLKIFTQWLWSLRVILRAFGYCIRNRPSDLWDPNSFEIHKSMKIWSEGFLIVWLHSVLKSNGLQILYSESIPWQWSFFLYMFSHKIMRNPKAWQMPCLSLNSQYSTWYIVKIQLLLLNRDWTIFGGIDLFLFNQCISSFPFLSFAWNGSPLYWLWESI